MRAAFGDDAVLHSFDECTEGWFNAVHRLGLADGRAVILKVAPPADVPVLRYEHDLITTEVDALRLVGERTDVPVPAVLAWHPEGGVLPSPWFVMEVCPGVLLSTLRDGLDPAQQLTVDTQTVRHLASMHAIGGPGFGRPAAGGSHPTWSGAFAELIDDLLADGTDAGVDLPVPVTSIRDLVARSTDALDEVRSPRLVHWDVWDPNVFVDPASLRVVGIIDFERVLWADPLMEAQFVAKRADDELIAAYGSPLFEAPGAARRRRLYDLYLYLVMIIESSYRNYETDDIESFARLCLDGVLAELGLT